MTDEPHAFPNLLTDKLIHQLMAGSYAKGLEDGIAQERERIAGALRKIGVSLTDEGVKLNIMW